MRCIRFVNEDVGVSRVVKARELQKGKRNEESKTELGSIEKAIRNRLQSMGNLPRNRVEVGLLQGREMERG